MSARERLAAAGIAAAVLAAICIARVLTPDLRGLGTHEQLWLPPCATAALLHVPCPLCGMTTAFSAMAHGMVREAFRIQPAGASIFVAAAAAGVVSALFALSGRWTPAVLAPLRSKRVVWAVLVGIVLAWGYKIATYVP